MKFAFAVLCCLLALTPVQARLGDTLGKIKERFGKPADQPRKGTEVWYFEAEDGQLAYSVVFNAKGLSISERFEPVRRAQFTDQAVQSFIKMQLEVDRGSKTARTVKPGENYTFAGKAFSCAVGQVVIIDEPNGILIVWTRSGVPSVMAVRPEAM
jgi:hypothetical protein